MFLIGESVHIVSKQIQQAIIKKDPKPIQRLSIQQFEAGADYLDLNLGALSKEPVKTIKWVIEAVQDVCDLPLCLDTINAEALKAGCEICKKSPIINSANGTRSSMDTVMPLAAHFDANLIVMTYNDDGMPSDADERASMAMDIAEHAGELGISPEKLWFDAILMPACTGQQQIFEFVEFTKIFNDVIPDSNTVTGLSNISSCGTPKELRGYLNHVLYIILKRYGQSALIADVLDPELMRLHRGELAEREELIHAAEDQQEIDISQLSDIEKNYVKTVDVVLNRKFYSHSWLED